MRKSKDTEHKKREEILRLYILLVQSLGHMSTSKQIRDISTNDASPVLHCLQHKHPRHYGLNSLLPKEIIQEIQSLIQSSPNKVHRVLDSNGRLKAFEERRFGLTDVTGQPDSYSTVTLHRARSQEHRCWAFG